MESQGEGFFAKTETKVVLRRFSDAISLISEPMRPTPNVIPHLKNIINLMISAADHFDKYCAFNIQHISGVFVSEMQGYFDVEEEDRKKESILAVFTSAYRFLCELDFLQEGELVHDLRAVKNFVFDNIDSFKGINKSQLVYAGYLMPASIAKKLIHNPAILEYRKLSSTILSAQETKERWDKDIEERFLKMSALEKSLKNISYTYNFVGLSKGFSDLLSKKRGEKTIAFISLIALGFVALLPVVFQVGFTVSHIEEIEKHKPTRIYSLPAILAAELLFLYFFRVVLLHFSSVKAQILQLELRVSIARTSGVYLPICGKLFRVFKENAPGKSRGFGQI